MIKNDLQTFLSKTYYCDCDNPNIINIAQNFKDKNSSQNELAKNLFYFVRDSTVYKVGNWTKKASETLSKKGGTCTNNANLLVALLRASGIPAGYGVMDVVGPNYFGPIVLHHFTRHVSQRSKHVYCYVYLNDKWIKCDPSDDEPLSINTHHLNPQSKLVEWNGLNDAMLNLNPSHIISDIGPIDNIDHIIGKKMRHRRKIPVFFGNLYIQFLREEGKKIISIHDLGYYFDKWLFDNHFFAYCLYKTFFSIEYIIRSNHTNEYK
jgi:hypothetical protein